MAKPETILVAAVIIAAVRTARRVDPELQGGEAQRGECTFARAPHLPPNPGADINHAW